MLAKLLSKPNAAEPLSGGCVETAVDGIDCAAFDVEVEVEAEVAVAVELAVEVILDGVGGGGVDTKEGKSSIPRVRVPLSLPPVL